MSTLRRLVHARLEPADYRQLQQEAAARGISTMACVSDCLREYFALRVEMASAVTAPGTLGEPQTGLVHSLLARTEERIRATLDAHAAVLQRLEHMVDRLVQLYLLHTPEVARELHAGAVASANRRYAKYRAAVRELLSEDGDGGPSRDEGRGE